MMRAARACLWLALSACAARGGAHATMETPVRAPGASSSAAASGSEAENANRAGAPAPSEARPAGPEVLTMTSVSAGDSLPPDGYAGSIARAGLVTMIDQGLGRFLTRLRLSPVLEGPRFVGFAVAGIDPVWGDIGLLPGDVIQRVNGQSIERPEQAMAAFESLRVASEVAIDFTRAGVPASLRYRIE